MQQPRQFLSNSWAETSHFYRVAILAYLRSTLRHFTCSTTPKALNTEQHVFQAATNASR
jgi:hypothetical protein